MPFSLVGWSESITPAAALTVLDALTDDHITEIGDNIHVPDNLNKIMLAYAQMTLLDRAQIRTPSLQVQMNLELSKLVDGTEPNSPQDLDNYLPEGIQLDAGEQMQAFVQAASGTIQGLVLAWLFDSLSAVPPGKRFTVRFTAGTAAVAYTWGSRPITLSETLLAGRYAVIGAKVISTSAIGFRFIFTGQSERPGGLGIDDVDDVQHPIFRNGGLGVWGSFEHDQLPRLEMLCITTDSAFVGFLDLIKIA